MITNIIKLPLLLITVFLLLGCTPAPIIVDIDEKVIQADIEKEVSLKFRLRSTEPKRFSIYSEPFETITLLSNDTSCYAEIKGMPSSVPSSELLNIEVDQNNHHTLELAGFVTIDRDNKRFIVDFGKVGRICSKTNSRSVEFVVGIIVEESWLDQVSSDSIMKTSNKLVIEIPDSTEL